MVLLLAKNASSSDSWHVWLHRGETPIAKRKAAEAALLLIECATLITHRLAWPVGHWSVGGCPFVDTLYGRLHQNDEDDDDDTVEFPDSLLLISARIKLARGKTKKFSVSMFLLSVDLAISPIVVVFVVRSPLHMCSMWQLSPTALCKHRNQRGVEMSGDQLRIISCVQLCAVNIHLATVHFTCSGVWLMQTVCMFYDFMVSEYTSLFD